MTRRKSKHKRYSTTRSPSNHTQRRNKNKRKYAGVCAFDIDKTLTCGENTCSRNKINLIEEAIETCRQQNMAVVINTARPFQRDLLHSIPEQIKTNLVKNQDKIYYHQKKANNVDIEKLRHMNELQNDFNIPIEKSILIDDLLTNCNTVKKNGGRSIHVKKRNGIDDNNLEELIQHINQIKKLKGKFISK